jgi:hypothetical protein
MDGIDVYPLMEACSLVLVSQWGCRNADNSLDAFCPNPRYRLIASNGIVF